MKPLHPVAGVGRSVRCLAAAAGGLMVAATAVEAAPFIPALSPAEALQAFRVEPGLRVELVAAEPLVVDPVAFAFDDHGRLFVVESRGYPGEVKKDQSQSDAPASTLGRIALLEDRDGDGRFETRTEFATGLTFPNGILPWRGGVFVTCAPDIYFLKDNDGDGVADERSVVLTGFSTSRTTQIRVSHPTLGLEGKVYVTSGLNGGKVIAPLHPERPAVTFTPADGRFDPATLVFETTGGRAQFGLSIDDFGRRFICSNRHPVMQVVLEPWHLRRNPHLAFAETVQNVSRVEAEAVVWPISRASVTAEFIPSLMTKPHNGTFTAASGVLEFGGTGLGEQFVGSVFICESAQNLVQRQVLRPAGASFRAEPARVGLEFLASTDVWFRPVSLGEGPDGALYLADMYRREIDHPAYVPEESRGQLDFLSGSDRGRIYRVIREAAVPRRRVRVGSSAAELVRDLESPDRWWRERAQRLLVERADPASVPLVEQVARAATQPAARSRALWTLAGLERLSPALLLAAFADSAAPVREQAVLLAASRIASSPELAGALIRSAADADARVRFCAALALGSWPDQRALAPLAAVAAQDGEDRWARAAVLSGVGGRLEAFRAAFAAQHAMGSAAAIAPVMEDLGRICGAGASTAERARFLAETLGAPEEAPWRVPAVLGLAEGLRTRGEFKNKPAGA
ncbi:MAG: dehydrogenase, partial [Verrucomicrobia bacterium]|nr:dehydrogenase [Verrucomicrobiota bacterium]